LLYISDDALVPSSNQTERCFVTLYWLSCLELCGDSFSLVASRLIHHVFFIKIYHWKLRTQKHLCGLCDSGLISSDKSQYVDDRSNRPIYYLV
jgi:hypothetical protein